MANIKAIVKAGTAVARDEWQRKANGYRITLKRNGKQMSVDFWSGVLCDEPKAFDVMCCLTSDASGLVNTSCFEGWCDSFGYEHDKENKRIYKAVVNQTNKLRKFLGSDFDSIIYMDEEELKDWCER